MQKARGYVPTAQKAFRLFNGCAYKYLFQIFLFDKYRSSLYYINDKTNDSNGAEEKMLHGAFFIAGQKKRGLNKRFPAAAPAYAAA
jgi:hypothetical protein